MLKSAGVDRFSLLQRLRELDPDQAANLARIYNAQLAVVSRCVEELRFCEKHLLQKGFSKRLEEELIPSLPLEKDQLASLAAGPHDLRDERQALSEIAESSPIPITRTLASIALLRLGHFKGSFAVASRALDSDDPETALEAALAFAHWRVRLSPYDLWWSAQAYEWGSVSRGIDRRTLAKVAGRVPPGSPLRSWAAAAVALAWFGEYGVLPQASPAAASEDRAPPDWLRTELLAGLTQRDPDLRFTCAMALGEDHIVIPMLDSGDTQKKLVARRFLVRRNSPAIAPLLLESPEEVREEIVNNLEPPLPAPLLEPVLQVALDSSGSLREQCVRLLAPSLNEAMVERLVRLGAKEKDLELFRTLLGADRLPAARDVVRAVLNAGLLVPLSGSLADAARHVDFADEELLRLAGKEDPSAIEHLVFIAREKINSQTSSEGGPCRDAGRFLARVAFSACPASARERAWAELAHGRVWDLFTPGGIHELFGGRKHFAHAILRGLEQRDPTEVLRSLLEKLSERWTEVAAAFTEDRAVVERFVHTVARLANDEDSACRSDAARLLVTAAVTCPAAALPAVTALLRERGLKWECRDVPAWLLAEYETFGPRLAHARSLVADLADVLAGMLREYTPEQRCGAALDLLVRLVRDHPALRESVRKRIQDGEFGEDDVLSTLGDLAGALGYEEPGDTQNGEEERPSAPDAGLDHFVVLPEAPLKTLAEYVGFMKAMAGSGDPLSVMAAHGMTQEDFVACVSGWGDALASNDKLAGRYAFLIQQ